MKVGARCPCCGLVPDAAEVDVRHGVCRPCLAERKRAKRVAERMAAEVPNLDWLPAWRALGLPEVRA